MATNKKVTLREVALQAGVSVATASRVLNKIGSVHPDIQQAVHAAVEELGYYQNTIARSLKTNATLTIGFLTADISNPYMIVVARAIEDIVRGKKYNLLVCSTEGDPERELEYLRVLMGRSMDALVLNGTGRNADFIEKISRRIPVLLVHRRYNSPGFRGDLIDSENEQGMFELTDHLVSLGHRKIFIVKGRALTSSNSERLKGFCAAMQSKAGITVDAQYPFQFDGDFSMRSGYDAIEHMCTLPDKPTAVLTFNNSMALGALEGLRARSLRVPEAVSIATYNNIDFRSLMSVRPTVYHVDPRDIGLQAGYALLERLEDPGLPNRELIVKGCMIPGNAVSVPGMDLPGAGLYGLRTQILDA